VSQERVKTNKSLMTPEEMRREYERGASLQQVADMSGISRQGVHQKLKRLGYEPRPPKSKLLSLPDEELKPWQRREKRYLLGIDLPKCKYCNKSLIGTKTKIRGVCTACFPIREPDNHREYRRGIYHARKERRNPTPKPAVRKSKAIYTAILESFVKGQISIGALEKDFGALFKADSSLIYGTEEFTILSKLFCCLESYTEDPDGTPFESNQEEVTRVVKECLRRLKS
jgi:hypothetical protein